MLVVAGEGGRDVAGEGVHNSMEQMCFGDWQSARSSAWGELEERADADNTVMGVPGIEVGEVEGQEQG